MIGYVIFTIIFLFLGIQLGVFAIMKKNGHGYFASLLVSASIYLLPFIITFSYISLWMDRREIKKEMFEEEVRRNPNVKIVKRRFFDLLFAVHFWLTAVKDILTPIDNIVYFVNFALDYGFETPESISQEKGRGENFKKKSPPTYNVKSFVWGVTGSMVNSVAAESKKSLNLKAS